MGPLEPNRMEERHQQAADNISKAQEKQMTTYRKRMRPNEKEEKVDVEIRGLQAGALVVIRNRKKKKLDPAFLGPFVFESFGDSPDAAILRNSKGERWKESIYNIGIYRGNTSSTHPG